MRHSSRLTAAGSSVLVRMSVSQGMRGEPSYSAGCGRTAPGVLGLAAALKRENPGRTAAQIQRILRTTQGWSPTERTLQRHFVAAGLTAGGSSETSVFGRFEATRGNELWTGDALQGPKIGGRKTYFATQPWPPAPRPAAVRTSCRVCRWPPRRRRS